MSGQVNVWIELPKVNGKPVKSKFKILIASFVNLLIILGTESSKYSLGSTVSVQRKGRDRFEYYS